MTLADLFTELCARGPMPRAAARKSSLKVLALALGYPSLEACPASTACRAEASWGKALEAYWDALTTAQRTLSANYRRNIKNDLRNVFKLAQAYDLLTVPLPVPLPLRIRGTRQEFVHRYAASAPYKTTYRGKTPRHYGLKQSQWPPDVQAGWEAYRAKVWMRLRDRTLQAYSRWLETYLGFLANIRHQQPTWDDVFKVELLSAYVEWQGKRVGQKVSTHGHHVVIVSATIAQVMAHDEPTRAVAMQLATLRTELKPAPLHVKSDHMLPLAEIERIANACLAEARRPFHVTPDVQQPGVMRAARFQQGVLLKLLVRWPIRKRNLREMRLDKNLKRDHQGDWQLKFEGAELKIAMRRDQPNKYEVNLTEYGKDAEGTVVDDFITILEEFLHDFRPRFPGAATAPWVFLTMYGNQWGENIGTQLAYTVASYAEYADKRFFPHIMRTIWATEYLTEDEVPDWTTAAVMLGDTVATVQRTYHHLVDEKHHPKAKAFLRKQLRTG